MLRAIIKRRMTDRRCGLEIEDYYTVDFEAPEIEARLQGGFNEESSESHTVIGVERISAPTQSQAITTPTKELI